MAFEIGEGGDAEDPYRPLAEINVTPLVDVMLVLLIVFMVTAPLMTAGIKVDLPPAHSAQPVTPKPPVVVTVGKDGAITIGSDAVSLDDLPSAVRAKFGGDPDRSVHIRGDRDAAFGAVIAVLDRLKAAGVEHIAILANKLGPGRSDEAPRDFRN